MVLIRVHYGVDDPDFIMDYYAVDVIIDNRLVKIFGDAYHDRGLVKAEAFAEGYNLASDGYLVQIENIADYEV